MNKSSSREIAADITALLDSVANPMGHMRILCDEIGPRPSGSPGERRASEYLAKAFRELGLSDVRREEFIAPHWSRGGATARIVKPVERQLEVLAMAMSGTSSIEGDVVWGSYETEEEFLEQAPKLHGNICLHQPERRIRVGKGILNTAERGILAAEAGATAFLWGSNWPGCLPHIGAVDSATSGHMPTFAIAMEDSYLLKRLLQQGEESIRLSLEMENKIEYGTSWNVSAELPAGDEAPVVMVTAHYDGHDISPAAFDNAAGVSCVLECARLLATRAPWPCTIRFVIFSAEELGLGGSKAYVEQHAEELERIRFLLNADGLGAAPSTNYMHLPFRDDVADYVRDACARLHLAMDIESVVALHWDHAPFALKGVPVGSITARWPSGTMLHYGHTRADTLDKIDESHLKASLGCMASLVAFVALDDDWPFRHTAPPNVEWGS